MLDPSENPYQTPSTGSLSADPKRYGGIGRLAFALVVLGLMIVAFVLSSWAESRGVAIGSTLHHWVFLTVLAFTGVLPRTRNLGMHPANALLIIVPVANLILGIRCLAYPEGFAATKTLDRTGKLILAAIVFFFVAGFVAILIDF